VFTTRGAQMQSESVKQSYVTEGDRGFQENHIGEVHIKVLMGIRCLSVDTWFSSVKCAKRYLRL
jgi:hypothetical protein